MAALGVVLVAGVLGATPLIAEPVDLAKSERTVFSQWGEDGVIERIFEVIQPTNKFAVEFGAFDGVHNSNTRNLVVNHGWSALMIEGDPKRAAELKANYKGNDRVKAVEAWVYPGNIETLFEDNGVPKDLDLLVIDIDSNDYWVWKVIQSFRPKVVQLEANQEYPPPQLMVIAFHPMNFWDGSDYHGASLQSYYNLAKKKGYELIYHCQRGTNFFVVDKQYYERFGISDNSPVKIYPPKAAEALKQRRKPGAPFLNVPAQRIQKQYLRDR
jgi:hypothetical protein